MTFLEENDAYLDCANYKSDVQIVICKSKL